MPYAFMARGSPWVTPSFLCKKWPDPYPMSLTTRVAQWRAVYIQLLPPLGHTGGTGHQ